MVEKEEKFRSIFENAQDVIIIVDKLGKIVEVNGKVEAFIGTKRENIIGKNFVDLGIFKSKRFG